MVSPNLSSGHMGTPENTEHTTEKHYFPARSLAAVNTETKSQNKQQLLSNQKFKFHLHQVYFQIGYYYLLL